MLGRAEKDFGQSVAKKAELSRQLSGTSPPTQDGNIADGLKKVRQSSQSIGGFVGGAMSLSRTNRSNILRPRSPNIKQPLKRVASSAFRAYPSPDPSDVPSVLSKPKTLQNIRNTVDLTQDSQSDHRIQALSQHVDVFAGDFDSDVDFSGDDELPKNAKSMAAPPKPMPKSPPTTIRRQASQASQSSIMSWSSSPLSHLAPPPTALSRVQEPFLEEEDSPRPAKRRALPWAQEKAETDERAAMEADRAELMAGSKTSSSSLQDAVCFRCKTKGHYASNCPERGSKSGTVHDFTPLPKGTKGNKMPWQNTASAMAAEKKLYKDKHKFIKSEKDRKQSDRPTVNKTIMAPVTLSEEQQRVLDLVCNQSKSVFFTGSAGTGKSVLMRAIIAALKKKYFREPERVAVTASTGLAACNIGGVTLHSFGGIGLGKEDVSTLVKKIRRNQKAKNRWLKTKILIVDEISMVDGDLFDKLEGIARALRNNGRPFGGIQLVITGDFFQLPPVPDYDNKARGAKFAFDANTWSTTINHTIGLTEVFRQKDPVFANMLNEMRLGKITEETVQAFKRLNRPLDFSEGLSATELFPTRNEVENSNQSRMRSLVGTSWKYEALDTGTMTDLTMRDKLLSNMMAPKMIELKKGAQVMLIKNMDEGLVNGSLGHVTSFMNEQEFDIYDKNPDSYNELAENQERPSTGKRYPMVRFVGTDGTSREILVQEEEWKVELPNGEIQAQRKQLPLILAWALSIHKAQGQTLPLVKIDLKKIFEKGQAYVALSRAISQAGLVVLNFDKSKVMAHPRVAQFYNSLYSVNAALENPKIAKITTRTLSTTITTTTKTKVKTASKEEVFEMNDDDDEEAMIAAYG